MWSRSLFQAHKDNIISIWLNGINSRYPGQYNLEKLRENGKLYFQLITDVDLPIEEHPLNKFIYDMCQHHAENATPFTHLLKSSHIWRNSFLQVVGEWLEQKIITQEDVQVNIPVIHKRIDDLQEFMCSTYWTFAEENIKQNERTIKELHEDRLSLLGKMAATMAHELRNPLFSIQGFIKLLRSELSSESSANVSKYCDIIESEFNGLYQLITTFLSFSKKESNDEPFEWCRVKDLIEPVITLLNPRINESSIEMEVDAEDNIEAFVQKGALQQVISNLLSNSMDALLSVKYSKKIIIRCWQDAKQYYISIADNGPGIPEKLKNTIFEPFVTGKESGTGLGLAICKKIMEKNKGEISFTSREGETVFILTLGKKSELVS